MPPGRASRRFCARWRMRSWKVRSTHWTRQWRWCGSGLEIEQPCACLISKLFILFNIRYTPQFLCESLCDLHFKTVQLRCAVERIKDEFCTRIGAERMGEGHRTVP